MLQTGSDLQYFLVTIQNLLIMFKTQLMIDLVNNKLR